MHRKKHERESLRLSVSPIGRPSATSFRPCSVTPGERWWTSLVKFAEPMHEARGWTILRFRRRIWWKNSSFSFCTDESPLRKIGLELPRVFFFERTRGSFRWCSLGVGRRAEPPARAEQGANRIVPRRRKARCEARGLRRADVGVEWCGNDGTEGRGESGSRCLKPRGERESGKRKRILWIDNKFTFFVRFTGRLFETKMAPNVVLKILVRIFARNRDEKRGRSHLVENAYTVRRFFARSAEALTYILYIIV